MLLKAGKKEPNGLARCIALSSLGIFVYRELAHQTFHPKLKDAIFVLLAALKFNNKAVAQVSVFLPKLKDAIFVLLAALKFNNKAVAQVSVFHPKLKDAIWSVILAVVELNESLAQYF